MATQIEMEDIPLDVSAIVNGVEHLCDISKQGAIHGVAAYTIEIARAADKLSDLSIKLIDMRESYKVKGSERRV